ncbi:hypothetical protein XpiCFBP4643_19045 [Xanthomonas pisi]|uniref:Uncharacterized protein n=1 Tax=Xanthomonas pisi TaxID=56457 RepID=A0A2S7CYB1_9XANT|nr:hypothetical protein XpiCFBP4643_19045 [Xanthomonas pisi]
MIAAVLAVAKLIADKESKISDFRKDWINSYRAALSEMLGEAYVIAGRIRIRAKHAQFAKANRTDARSAAGGATIAPAAGTTSSNSVGAGSHTTLLTGSLVQVVVTVSKASPPEVASPATAQPSVVEPDHSSGSDVAAGALAEESEEEGLLSAEEILDLEQELTSHWNTLRKAHRTVLLHMNFNETAWGTRALGEGTNHRAKAASVWQSIVSSCGVVDQDKAATAYDASKNGDPSGAAVLLVDQLEDLVGKLLGEYHVVGGKARYEEIKKAIDCSTLLGNLVLKPEWNRIKSGEPKFKFVVFGLWALALSGSVALLYSSLSPRKAQEPAMPTTIIVQVKEKRYVEPLTCPKIIALGEEWTARGPISSNLPWCHPPGI